MILLSRNKSLGSAQHPDTLSGTGRSALLLFHTRKVTELLQLCSHYYCVLVKALTHHQGNLTALLARGSLAACYSLK